MNSKAFVLLCLLFAVHVLLCSSSALTSSEEKQDRLEEVNTEGCGYGSGRGGWGGERGGHEGLGGGRGGHGSLEGGHSDHEGWRGGHGDREGFGSGGLGGYGGAWGNQHGK